MQKALAVIYFTLAALLLCTFSASGQESDREMIEKAYHERAYVYPEHECMLNIGMFPNGFYVHYKMLGKTRKVLPNPDYSPGKDGSPLCIWEWMDYNVLDSAKVRGYAVVYNAPDAFKAIERNPKTTLVIVQDRPMPHKTTR